MLQLEIDINMFYLTYKYKEAVLGGPQEAGVRFKVPWPLRICFYFQGAAEGNETWCSVN